MITPQNRIIIVDDQLSELQKLAKVFLNIGIGCRTFEYTKTYNEPLNDIRIAFFDVDLGEKNIDTTNLSPQEIENNSTAIFNDLAYAINQYISTENGPYALIFWTKNKSLIQGFKNYIDDLERGYSNTAKPFLIDCFDKTELTETTNIKSKLEELFINDKIKLYFEIEENARLAGSKTIDKLHNIIPKDTKWSENSVYFKNIDKVLSKIAVNVLGYDYALKQPLKGIYEGLSHLVLKEFLDSQKSINPKELMTTLFNSTSQNEIEFPEKIISSKLNTIFHIDESCDVNTSTRGAVFELNLESLNSDSFKPSYHFSLSGYFKNLNIFNSKLFFRFNNTASKEDIQKVKSEIKFIAVEISASCDYSQNKIRNNKFILGILTPTIDTSIIDLESTEKSSLYNEIPNFYYKEKEYSIYLNLNFVFSDSDLEFIGKPKFVLKKEIVDMIGNRYANHVSRIGITSF